MVRPCKYCKLSDCDFTDQLTLLTWKWSQCKSLAPEFEKLGSAFSASKDVIIAQVDADSHKKLAKRFDIKGFPTLKWVQKGSTFKDAENVDAGRTAEDLLAYVNKKTGLSKKLAAAEESLVVDLTPESFGDVAKNKETHALVGFFAPWYAFMSSMRKNVNPCPSPVLTLLIVLRDSFCVANHLFFCLIKVWTCTFPCSSFPQSVRIPSFYLHAYQVRWHNSLPLPRILFHCIQCKALKPTWEQLAKVFADENEVIIAAVNCDAHSSLAEEFGVQGFPSIKYFGSSGEAEDFKGGRDVEDFVNFLNEKAQLELSSDGGVSISAGVIKELADHIKAFVSAPSDEERIKAVDTCQTTVESLDERAKSNFAYYVKVFAKVADRGVEYIKGEKQRLSKLLESSASLKSKQKKSFMRRLNVLNEFSEL